MATPPESLAILSESFLERYELSVSARSFFICKILACISGLVEGSATKVVELLVMVTFLAMPSWSDVALSRVSPKSPERKSAPNYITMVSIRMHSAYIVRLCGSTTSHDKRIPYGFQKQAYGCAHISKPLIIKISGMFTIAFF